MEDQDDLGFCLLLKEDLVNAMDYMSISLAFSQPSPLRVSWATTVSTYSLRRCSTARHGHQRGALPVAAVQPPQKPAYYKNPSRAIEKGGGFYVPGLQGPRLRFFVPVASAVFLVLNHLLAGASTDVMTRSEGLAVIATVAVLGTAILDTRKELKPSSDQQNEQIYKSTVAPEKGMSLLSTADAMTSSTSISTQWASAVVRDLVPGMEIAHFRNNEAIFRTSNVVGWTAGVAVERVVKEQRPLYIAKSSSLPEEVTVPFLGDGEWSIFMVPTKAEDVVVFASRQELSRDNRRWLEVFSERMAE